MAADIGKRVAYYREQATDAGGKRMTVQALADRCAKLGVPLDRTVITKLEKGRRQSVTMPELVVLARALEVAPILLLFPVGLEKTMEVLPGTDIPTADGMFWFTGERPWPLHGGESTGTPAVDDAATLFRNHGKFLHDWQVSMNGMLSAARSAESAQRDDERERAGLMALQHQAVASAIVGQLRRIRRLMRDQGLTPPELPGELAHLDEAPGGHGDAS